MSFYITNGTEFYCREYHSEFGHMRQFKETATEYKTRTGARAGLDRRQSYLKATGRADAASKLYVTPSDTAPPASRPPL